MMRRVTATPRSLTARERLDRVMNHVATELAVAALIVLSVALLLVEVSLAPSSPWRAPLARANDVITWLFVVELSLRFVAERRKRRFFRRFWLDIIAVLPLLRAFRMLRILRLLRLFRLGAMLGQHARQFSAVFRYVKVEYLFGSLLVVVLVLMGAMSLRFAEGRDAFASFEEAVWFSVTTVAASEPVLGAPTTRFGRVVTLALMLGGMTVFAFFTGTVSAVMIDSFRKLRFVRMELEELEDHVVVCGWNLAGELFLEELSSDASPRGIVIVSDSPELNEDALLAEHGDRVHVIREDFTKASVLRQAGVERAAFAVVLADAGRERSTQDRDARTVLAAMLVEKLNAEIHTTVQLLNAENEASLREAGVEDLIVGDDYVGSMMANVVKNRGMVPVIAEVLTSRYGQRLFKSPAPPAIHGMRVGDAIRVLKERHDATLLAVELEEGGFVVNPKADFEIQPGHQVVVTALAPISS
jgi:voltage-gated potassium channel